MDHVVPIIGNKFHVTMLLMDPVLSISSSSFNSFVLCEEDTFFSTIDHHASLLQQPPSVFIWSRLPQEERTVLTIIWVEIDFFSNFFYEIAIFQWYIANSLRAIPTNNFIYCFQECNVIESDFKLMNEIIPLLHSFILWIHRIAIWFNYNAYY
jgi:hypothetical protein